MSLAAGTRLGPYEITSALGAGGMGEVYRARDTRLDRTVAIKILPASMSADPSLRQRFEREARVISSLDHPHICGLFDVGTDDGRDYLVMQYLEGVSLGSRLERGALPQAETLRIGAQIADALAAAHRRGIVHRDLKPANIMLTPGGAVLLDFGLAKETPVTGPSNMRETMAALTAERTILGTLHYMAPEQVEGREADARSDIFALGAVLYEMLSGRRAFDGESPASVIAGIMSSEPKSLVDLVPLTPAPLARVIGRCLAKNPDERWQSAADLAFELRTVADIQPLSAMPPRPSRSPALAWLMAALLGAALGAASALWLTPKGSRQVGSDELRLTVLPPNGHSFAATVSRFDSDFALSPDGTHIAFVTADAAGVTRLWIRPLASMTPRVVSGSEGADRPFWSPDSKSIGFATEAGICRVTLPDGAIQVLVNSTQADGDSTGSWAADTILFESLQSNKGQPLRSIFKVPASGGTTSPVSRGTHPPSETGQRYPDALPDGRHFIYLSWAADPQQRGVYLGSLDSDERTLLVQTGFRAEFVAPDILFYIRDRALVSQRVSIASRRVVGEPSVIVEQLAVEAIPGHAAFGVSDSGTVVYRTVSRDVESELRWIDRAGNASEPLAPRASDITTSLSPDERIVAFTRVVMTSSEDRKPGNIWLFDLIRRVPSRFTLDGANIDENPVWSPDGRTIAYASHRRHGLAEVRLQDVSEPGAGAVLFQAIENFHPIDWSADGKHLLLQGYGTGTGADNIDLWIVEPRQGASPQPLVTQPKLQSQGQFSPDGKWLVYTSDETGRPEIYLRPFPAGPARIQVSSSGGAQPRWRGDSRELFYVAPDGTIMAVPIDTAGAPGTPAALFREPSLRVNNSVFFYGGAAAYEVSRDGSRFLLNRLTKQPEAGPLHLVLNSAGPR